MARLGKAGGSSLALPSEFAEILDGGEPCVKGDGVSENAASSTLQDGFDEVKAFLDDREIG